MANINSHCTTVVALQSILSWDRHHTTDCTSSSKTFIKKYWTFAILWKLKLQKLRYMSWFRFSNSVKNVFFSKNILELKTFRNTSNIWPIIPFGKLWNHQEYLINYKFRGYWMRILTQSNMFSKKLYTIYTTFFVATLIWSVMHFWSLWKHE